MVGIKILLASETGAYSRNYHTKKSDKPVEPLSDFSPKEITRRFTDILKQDPHDFQKPFEEKLEKLAASCGFVIEKLPRTLDGKTSTEGFTTLAGYLAQAKRRPEVKPKIFELLDAVLAIRRGKRAFYSLKPEWEKTAAERKEDETHQKFIEALEWVREQLVIAQCRHIEAKQRKTDSDSSSQGSRESGIWTQVGEKFGRFKRTA